MDTEAGKSKISAISFYAAEIQHILPENVYYFPLPFCNMEHALLLFTVNFCCGFTQIKCQQTYSHIQ